MTSMPSRVEVRWLTSTYRSAHYLTTKSRGACSAARSPKGQRTTRSSSRSV